MRAVGIAASCLIIAGCVFRSPVIKEVDLTKVAFTESRAKVHMLDGSTVLFSQGFLLSGDTLIARGGASRFFLGAKYPVGVGKVSLDSVVGVEALGAKTSVAPTVVATTGAVVLGAVGGVVLLKAIFGSCPTFYADSSGVELLQGEGFSYAIAPLLEQRDVDRLRVVEAKNGKIVLRVRNEALETHYINHLELMEVERANDELVLGDNFGHPLALRNPSLPATVRDRAGRNVLPVVASLDEKVYSTHETVVRNVTASDLEDYIDLTVPVDDDADSVAVVLDMRNSLLNTVLLYNQILASQGVRSLDFLAKDLNRIAGAVDLGRWYASNMGMRVSVLDGSEYRIVTRLGDSGPIAFHKVAVMVPAIRNGGKAVHIRLSFVADDWRIDGITATSHWRRPTYRFVPASRVAMPDPAQNDEALTALSEPDENYLMTTAGQSLSVEFDVGQSDSARSWLLASQGYYTEWIRGSWIKAPPGKPFAPTNASLVDAIATWRDKQHEMEKTFFASRIPTRPQ